MVRVALVVLVPVALMITACSRQTLLIVTDQYWKTATLDRITSGMQRVSKERGVRVHTKVVNYSPSLMPKLVGAVEGTAGSYVLLSPLYSHYASALAAHFQDRRFISFSLAPTPAGLDNVVYLVSQPASAFTDAAKRIAGYVAANVRDRSTGGEEIVGVFADNASGQNALTAFRKGLNDTSSQATLSVIQVGGSSDRSRLRSFLDASHGKGIVVYVLASSTLDAYAVDLLSNSTAPIVTLNWSFGATYSDKVLFSIDEDIPAALVKILEPMGPSADKEIRIPWDIVAGMKGS